MSGHVASQTRSLPLDQGTTVTLSGRERPDGSRQDGTFADVKALCKMTMMASLTMATAQSMSS